MPQNYHTHKEIQVTQFSPDPSTALSLVEVATKRPERGQVAILVFACSLSFPDTLLCNNEYQFKPQLPFSPGSEVSGIVSAVGEGCNWAKSGMRVRAGFIFGGFKEVVVANEPQCHEIPLGLSYTTAFLGNYITSFYSLKIRGQIRPGNSVLVLGASGGIGKTSIELAKAFGASVIAAASTEAKREACLEMGADYVVDYEAPQWHKIVKRLTDGKGVDIIVDPVGDKYTEPAVRALAWGGRLLVVGFAAGSIPKIPTNLLLLKGAAAVGVFHGMWPAKDGPGPARAANEQLLGMISTGQIKPSVSTTYDLEDAAMALTHMKQRKTMGKVVLVTSAFRDSQQSAEKGCSRL